MIRKIINWFSKNEDGYEMLVQLSKDEKAKFILKVDNVKIGTLSCEAGKWHFKYSSEFKNHSDEYNRITGFPDLDKVYNSDYLWPFFQIRIPGLKQPAIQEILKNEQIDQHNEVALLKRFGKKNISNRYELVLA